MSAEQVFDCVVVGAGVQGSFTAYQLAKRNKKTLLLEQFILPHTRGSSHGQSRIIRKAYDLDFYSKMMVECYDLWAELEREAGVKLYRQTGLLVMGPQNGEESSYQQYKETLEIQKVPMKVLTPENFHQHIPQIRLAQGHGAVVDITAGVLFADRVLRTVQTQFQKLGGVVRDNQEVKDITPGPVVTIRTSAGVYKAKSLVITAGAWANRVLSHTGLELPLEVQKINVCYWKEKVPDSHHVQKRFPCFLVTEGEHNVEHIYGLPSNEYPGLIKICYHVGAQTEPDQRDRQTNRDDVDILRRYVRDFVPGVEDEPAVVESCLYTLTPDRHFVLDYHPAHKNIVIGAGFSGHGFKFGPIVGKLLCQLTLGEVPSYDLSPFRIRRFLAKSQSAL